MYLRICRCELSFTSIPYPITTTKVTSRDEPDTPSVVVCLKVCVLFSLPICNNEDLLHEFMSHLP